MGEGDSLAALSLSLSLANVKPDGCGAAARFAEVHRLGAGKTKKNPPNLFARRDGGALAQPGDVFGIRIEGSRVVGTVESVLG